VHHLSKEGGNSLNQVSTPRHQYEVGLLSLLWPVSRARRFLHTTKNPAATNATTVEVGKDGID
jgi:hypothetical protein